MGTMPFKPIQIDIVSELNAIFADEFRVHAIRNQQPEKDYSNAVGLVLLILFLYGVYSWINGC